MRVLPLALLVCSAALHADVTLPPIFSDHMVLQKSARVPVWGQADPGEKVSATIDGQTVSTTAGPDGRWRVAWDLAASGPGPFVATVQGKNSVTISDVLVGEVWVASGQSNIEWTLKRTAGAEEEIARSANPLLRQFLVEKTTSPTPLEQAKGRWVVAGPETAANFTAVGYYFGKRLQNTLGVPVGLINTSWGGTPSEAWTSSAALDSDPDLKATREAQFAALAEYPSAIAAWRRAMGDWMASQDRADRTPADPAPFAAPGVATDGWTKISLPGEVSAPELPGGGALWIRRDITLPAEKTNADLPLELGDFAGFETVYWNGTLLTETTLATHPGANFTRRGGRFTVPNAKLQEGRNTLAIRIHTPAGPTKFPNAPKVGGSPPDGDWLARMEYTLPALSVEQAATQPQPPVSLPTPQTTSSHLYNAMIHPLVPYGIRGVIWYQGESNAGRAHQYRKAFPLLITDWRKAWDQGDFPFYFCQLASHKPRNPEPGDSTWAELREAQAMTLALPNTGQAVLIDVGEAQDIHPSNKRDVGERLARIALARDYGQGGVFSGPVYRSQRIADGKIHLTFSHPDGGLVAAPVPETYDLNTLEKRTAPTVRNSPGSELEGFAICGADRRWVWAEAKIVGDTVVVCSDKVPSPVAVRYAWADNPLGNLTNASGLPAAPFRTDDFPGVTVYKKF
jgi:sialate O-acetylesterase